MIPLSKKTTFIIVISFIFITSIISITSIIFISINNTSDHTNKTINNYSTFEKDYYNAYDNFNPNNFSKKGDLKNHYSSVSYPQNNLFNTKNDNYQDNPLQPRNRKIMFTDQNNEILFSISYLYTNNKLNTDIITVDTILKNSTEELLNIGELNINDYFQFIITYNNSIILINCDYISDNYDDVHKSYFYSQVKLFFKEFTDYLKSTSTIELE